MCKQHAECLIQKKIHHCTTALELVNQWVYLSNQQSYAGDEAIQTQPDQPPTLSPYLLNTACVGGRADGWGLRMTRISRNQTPLPPALMLMTML